VHQAEWKHLNLGNSLHFPCGLSAFLHGQKVKMGVTHRTANSHEEIMIIYPATPRVAEARLR
jgi:hypothetical protein